MKSSPIRIAFCAIASLALQGCRNAKVEVGLKSVSWLPATATNISYSKVFGWNAYECDMSELDFSSWTKSDGLEPAEIVSPIEIYRYTWLSASPKAANDTVEIRRGLHVQNISEGGAGYDLAFDRDNNRVYYHYQAH